MKSIALCVFVLLIAFGVGAQTTNPLVGAWELVYGKYGSSERSQPDNPFQLKVFSPNHFAFIMQKEDGTFDRARAGTYKIEGDKYIETHSWSSIDENVGITVTWEFRVEGDTLYMSGPTKVVDADGQEVEYNVMMEEVRRRAQKQ